MRRNPDPKPPIRNKIPHRRGAGSRDRSVRLRDETRYPATARSQRRQVSIAASGWFYKDATKSGLGMALHWSTDDIPPQDRIAFWCDFFAQQAHRFTPCDIPDPAIFRAVARGECGSGFALLEIESGLRHIRRTASDIAHDTKEALFVRRYHSPLIWKAGPRSTPVDLRHEAGDFCVSATEWEFDAEAREAVAFTLLVIPQSVLSPLLAGGRLTRPFRVPATSTLGVLLGTALSAASAQVSLLPPALAIAVLRNLAGLVALVCGASDEGEDVGRASIQAARLDAVKRHIKVHLADPALSPATAAAALGISVRQLHLLFEPTGTTFGQHVLRQRLLQCREGIAGATGTTRKVTDIAFGWGFNSMATFYRAFAAEFGAAPSALRGVTQARTIGSERAANGGLA
jgi:AraC-like DNA-binding protein